MNHGELLYLSRVDLEYLKVPMTEIRDLIHQVFKEKGEGLIESPPKRGILPTPTASIRAMKAFIPSLGAAGVKWISAYPENAGKGLPTINALVILNDITTGIPVAVMDGRLITAKRTAASTIVAARHLARKESASAGIIGCGVQGQVNLEAVCGEFPITFVKAFDIRPANARSFVEKMAKDLQIEAVVVNEYADAAQDVDILITSMPIIKNPDPPLSTGLLKAGSFTCLLDYDSAMTGDAMREADLLVTDDVRQLNFFRRIGYFRQTPETDGDLGKIVAGRQRGRLDDAERIISINMGIGVLDVALASLLYKHAIKHNVGTYLPL